MTRILLTIAIIFSFSMLASAQFKKGDYLLSGNLSYTYSSGSSFYSNSTPQESDQRNTFGNFSIFAGKALNETTAAGINLSYSPSTNNYYNGTYDPVISKTDLFSAGIFYRKYKALGKEFFFFGQVNVSYDWSNQSGKDTTGVKVLSGSSWGAGATFSPGIAYKISKHFFMELTIPALITVDFSKSNSLFQDNETPPYIQKMNNESFRISTSLSSNFISNLGIGFSLIL
jgi:hypothetical protein